MAANSLHRTACGLGQFARRHGATDLEQYDQLVHNRIPQQPTYAGLSVIDFVHRRPTTAKPTALSSAPTLRIPEISECETKPDRSRLKPRSLPAKFDPDDS